MIGEGLIALFVGIIKASLLGLSLVKLPVEMIGVLSTILGFGVWVVGLDVMGVFAGTIIFWWTFHMSIGLIVWVWDKLPLT